MDEIKQRLAELKMQLVNEDRNVLKEKIIDCSPCLIVDLATGLIVFASRRVNELFGYIYNQLEGMNVSALIPPEIHKRHEAHMGNYFRMPKFRNMGEHGMKLQGIKKDGTEIEVKISLEPFFEAGQGFVVATVIEI